MLLNRWIYAAALIMAGCGGRDTDDRTFTLYRASPDNPNMRVHVASFDANDKAEYNRENCDIAASLFRAQPGVKVKYWCEKGRYRK